MPQNTALINQRIFDNSIDLILVVDRGGTFVRVSPSSMKILGYEPEEMVGRSATEFLHPPDLENTREMMRQSRRGNVTRHFDCRYVHKDGSVVILTWTGTWSEEAQQHFFIGRDITEARAFEAIERDLERIDASIGKWSSRTTLRLADYCWVMELLVALDSAWGCWALLTGPSNFAKFTDTFALAAHLEANETAWGAAAGLAALLILLGGLVARLRMYLQWAIVIRSLGLIVAGSFWFCLGVSTVIGNNDTLFGMKGVTGGVVAYAIALRLMLSV